MWCPDGNPKHWIANVFFKWVYLLRWQIQLRAIIFSIFFWRFTFNFFSIESITGVATQLNSQRVLCLWPIQFSTPMDSGEKIEPITRWAILFCSRWGLTHIFLIHIKSTYLWMWENNNLTMTWLFYMYFWTEKFARSLKSIPNPNPGQLSRWNKFQFFLDRFSQTAGDWLILYPSKLAGNYSRVFFRSMHLGHWVQVINCAPLKVAVSQAIFLCTSW